MSRETRTDVVSQYADAPRDELSAWLGIAKRVRGTLTPVAALPAFRARLRDGLLMAARHQQAHRLTMTPRNESRLGWVIGAAALGSAAGLIALVLHSRASQRTNPRATPESSN